MPNIHLGLSTEGLGGLLSPNRFEEVTMEKDREIAEELENMIVEPTVTLQRHLEDGHANNRLWSVLYHLQDARELLFDVRSS